MQRCAALRFGLTIGVVLAAGCPKPAPVAPSPPPPADPRPPDPDAVEPGASAPSTTPAPSVPSLGPLRRESAYLFQPFSGRARTKPLAKRADYAAAAPSAQAILTAGCGGPAQLRADGGRRRLDVRTVETAVFSPDAQRVAIAGTNGRLQAFTVPDGEPIGASVEGFDPHFVGADRLVVRRGKQCQWLAIDLSAANAKPTPVGAPVCGDYLGVNAGRTAIVVAEPGNGNIGAFPTVRVVHALPLAGDDPGAILEPKADDPVAAPVLSPAGDKLCYVLERHDSPTLHCARIEHATVPTRVAKEIEGLPTFDDTGDHLLFTIPPKDGVRRDLYVVDFPLKLVRRIAHLPHRDYSFLPGGQRVAAWSGAHAVVYDLQTGYQIPFGGQDPPWDRVVPIPGDDSRLIARAPAKRCGTLHIVDLPKL